MADLLSYLAPRTLTAGLVEQAIGTADLLATKYRVQLPEDVDTAWRVTMRPALVRWLDRLRQENPR